ncbi:class I SAM-dependent methyltransferase [Streptomyces cyslabdanicus]|uniref:class I SAM-dependent methyltransferase n=1 Tax=Streptomyces cyslabdanicus TaxID=1470456 RepID=UPI004044D59C
MRASFPDFLPRRHRVALAPGACTWQLLRHALAERGVKAIGVDPSEQMMAVARDRWPEADFRITDAGELPLAGVSVDGCRCRVVAHSLIRCAP